MPDATFTCPRCFATVPLTAAARFCPHCGLPGAREAALDTAPLEIPVGGRIFRVGDRIAVGSVCAVYRCRFDAAGREVEGVLKVARDARSNEWVANEAAVLRRLHEADRSGRFAPFLPIVEQSLTLGDGGSPWPRQANVLRVDAQIRSPADELYTLAEVKSHYPAGLDPRDVAWIWRRLLSILGFVHDQGAVHGAVLPMHVLIDPRDHKLVLIDWCVAVADARRDRRPVGVITAGFDEWYRREHAGHLPPRPALDVAFAARCMLDLLGGDAARGEGPPGLDPAMRRHFRRCLIGDADTWPDAWRLLDDFDDLIEALWGPRRFRTFPMPPKYA